MTTKTEETSVTPVADNHPWRDSAVKFGALLLGFLLVLGIFIFSSHRRSASPTLKEISTPTLVAPTPKLTLSPQEAERVKVAIQQLDKGQTSSSDQEAIKLAQLRLAAPQQFFGNENHSSSGASQTQNTNNPVGLSSEGDPNSQFMAQVSQSKAPVEHATRIQHLNTTVAQGILLQAILETRIASDLPGMVRAVTSADVYAEDGSQLLLPKGSRLIGQYSSAISQGQNRVFVVWQRLIRPDGIDIQLNSTGTDTLGTAGLAADSIDHHFWQQFGTAALLSVIGAGTANSGVHSQDQFNSAAAYREALASSFAQSAQNTLQSTGVIKPTLYINQGTPISIFVARDLDFYDQLRTSKKEGNHSF